MKLSWNIITTLFVTLVLSIPVKAQNIPSPKEHFGFEIGDDYHLATFTATEAYFKKIAAASSKAKYEVIGKTEEGRDQFMLIITSPANQEKLAYYKSISQKLGNPDGLSQEQAKALANEGKAVVWIDGGLHSTETVATHQLIQTAYKLLSSADSETTRILDNVIILMVHANPDGQELVTNWYMRNPNPEKRTLQGLPRLYQKYVGHDNNRDFYMLNMKESQNIAKQLFVEWIPQIMYNHHQTAPAGAVVAGAPYRDPFNYQMDPLIISGLDAIGAANQNRLNVEDKPGYTSKSGSVFSTWYNGGLRTTTYFHNMVGLLTEIIGSPTPAEVPLVTSRLLPNSATPNPVVPQKWHFRQSIDYSVSLNYAMMDYAARNRDQLLYNIYKMGMNSIERGSKDYWALSPNKIEKMNKFIADSQKSRTSEAATDSEVPAWMSRSAISKKFFDTVMTNQTLKDPRGFIIPSDQSDFATAVEFLNALIKTGVVVHKATSAFQVNGKSYPANSYIVKTNQAFRPHVIDLFEPQDHPNDFQYPGGPPIPPYDAAGWTLAYQMGVKFDRIMEGFDGPFEKNPVGKPLEITAKLPEVAKLKGYLFNAEANNSFKVINSLLKNNIDVFRITKAVPGTKSSVGSFYVPVTAKTKSIITNLASTAKQAPEPLTVAPTAMEKIIPARVALWDTYGGSMPSGWIRWMFEQFDFPAKLIFANEIDTANLKSKYDVIVFVGGSIPGESAGGGRGGSSMPNADSIPEEYRHTLGRITVDKSIPQLKKFLEDGGSIVTLGSACNLAYHLKLPVTNALTEFVNGEEKSLPREKYFAPGSILKVHVNNDQPAAAGMGESADIYFANSPVFDISPAALSQKEIVPLLWFGKDNPLKSGWTWGHYYLQDKVTGFMANVGKGKLYAYGPEITFRAQSHGTFKLLFNQLYTTR
jgi:hypothetical protein